MTGLTEDQNEAAINNMQSTLLDVSLSSKEMCNIILKKMSGNDQELVTPSPSVQFLTILQGLRRSQGL